VLVPGNIDPFHRKLFRVGSKNLRMGQTRVAAETAIYILAGNSRFVFLDVDGDEPAERRVDTAPGDYIFVPPYIPHREENPDPDNEAVVVIARTAQEAIVVNLDGLNWSEVAAALRLTPRG
jgi:uncharacterized RmlC-like cupin family protein